MEKKPHNPSAFPRALDTVLRDKHGMSLLDYFAGRAMSSALSNPAGLGTIQNKDGTIHNLNERDIAETSYIIAQAMLIEREKHL